MLSEFVASLHLRQGITLKALGKKWRDWCRGWSLPIKIIDLPASGPWRAIFTSRRKVSPRDRLEVSLLFYFLFSMCVGSMCVYACLHVCGGLRLAWVHAEAGGWYQESSQLLFHTRHRFLSQTRSSPEKASVSQLVLGVPSAFWGCSYSSPATLVFPKESRNPNSSPYTCIEHTLAA